MRVVGAVKVVCWQCGGFDYGLDGAGAIKYGDHGSSMPWHEYLRDEEIWSLVNLVKQLRKQLSSADSVL